MSLNILDSTNEGDYVNETELQQEFDVERLRRKANQAWECAAGARHDGDKKDEAKWHKAAQRIENWIREITS